MGGSLAWEGGQSEDELCWGAGVDAMKTGREKRSVNTLRNN